jgi:amino acid transporter
MAASALEVRPRRRRSAMQMRQGGGGRGSESFQGQRLSRTFKLCAIWTPVAVWLAYSLASILVSLDVPQDECVLAPPSWSHYNTSETGCKSYDKRSDEGDDGIKVPVSVFVHIVRRLGDMPHFVNACIAFSAFTCASTNLYVASRELFGITCHIEGGRGQRNPLLRLAAWFGVTNRHRVPVRAMGFSAAAFMWVPIFKQTETERAKTFTAILSSMGTVGVLVVWASVCVAYIRYLACIRRHAQYLSDTPQVIRRASDYPYRSSPQPLLAYFAVFGTLFLLLIASSAPLWHQNEFNEESFLSSYLVIFLFIGLWVILKCARRGSWRPVDLSDAEAVGEKLMSLHSRTERWALANDEASNVNEA